MATNKIFEITGKNNNVSSGSFVNGSWYTLSNGTTEVGIKLQLEIGSNLISAGEEFKVLFSTPVVLNNVDDRAINVIEIDFKGTKNGKSFTQNITIKKDRALEWKLMTQSLKLATPNDKIKIWFKVPPLNPDLGLPGFSEVFTNQGMDDNIDFVYYSGDGFHIDFKKVKALHVDNKNFKEFSIDGHIYNFRQANLPADEQTPLQDLIDGYDWTHLSTTGKSLAANSLTWDQISGEPAIHTGVTITGITHPAISADGTLAATISFSRLLSDGSTDLATKQVNIAFILVKAAGTSVYYSHADGDVYKDGNLLYSTKDPDSTTIKTKQLIVDKNGDVYVVKSQGSIWKNGTKDVNLSTNLKNQTIAFDKDNNIISCGIYVLSSKYVVRKNAVTIPEWNVLDSINTTANSNVTATLVGPDNKIFISSMNPTVNYYGPDNKIDNTYYQYWGAIDKDGNYYMHLSTPNGDKITKNNVDFITPSHHLISTTIYGVDKNNNIYYTAQNMDDNKAYVICKNSEIIINVKDSTTAAVGDVALDHTNGDIWFLTADKKVWKAEANADGTYKTPVATYTIPNAAWGQLHLALSNEFGARTGKWD